MNRIFLIATCLLGTFQLSAQQEAHLSINSGIGKIGYRLYSGEKVHAIRLQDNYSPTFGINLSYSYRLGDFALESGVSFNDLKSNQTDGYNVTEQLIDGSTRVIKTDVVTERKARYLSIPLKLNYRIDKLQIGGGVYLSTLISNEYYAVQYTDDVLSGLDFNGNRLKGLDFGLTAQAEYALSNRASLLFSTNFGLMNVNSHNNFGSQHVYGAEQIEPTRRELKNRQIMLGLKFRLFKS